MVEKYTEITETMKAIWKRRSDLQKSFPHVLEGDPSPAPGGVMSFYSWWEDYYPKEKYKYYTLSAEELVALKEGGTPACIYSNQPQHTKKLASQINAAICPDIHELWPFSVIIVLGIFENIDIQSLSVLRNINQERTVVFYWIGTDVHEFVNSKLMGDTYKNFTHICVSEFLKEQLAEKQVDAAVIPLVPGVPGTVHDMPIEFSVVVDKPHHRFARYGQIMNVVKAMPDIKFYFLGDETKETIASNVIAVPPLPEYSLENFADSTSVYWRPFEHDGYPQTMMFWAMKGRHIIHSISYPHVNVCNTEDEVIALLNQLRLESKPNILGAVYYRNLAYNSIKQLKDLIGQKIGKKHGEGASGNV